MSIHTILSQEIDKIAAKGLELSDNDLWKYYRGEEFFDDLRSLATRIVEEAQREERERIKKILPVAARINNSGVVTIDYQEWVFFIRKIDSGTKLQKMKEI